MAVPALDDVHKLTLALVNISGESLQHDAPAELLALCATSSPLARRAFSRAAEIASTSAFRNVRIEAAQAYAENLLPPLAAVSLLLNLSAPKSAFRLLSTFVSQRGVRYSTATGLPFPRPLCTRDAFEAKWAELCTPLELVCTFSTTPVQAEARHWPLASWERYVNSRPQLRIPDGPRLHLIIRGDGYPVAGGSWSQMTIGMANHGPNARRPAFCWPIAIAIVNDHEMVTLGKLWAPLIEVPTRFCLPFLV